MFVLFVSFGCCCFEALIVDHVGFVSVVVDVVVVVVVKLL